MSIVVGSKLGRTVAIVLAAGLILFGTIQYIKTAERERVLNEVQKEDLENYKDTRERIDETKDDSIGIIDNALDFLRRRTED